MASWSYPAGMSDTLIRIGRGVPGPKQKPKPSHWLIAAAVIFSVGLMVFAVYFLDPPMRTSTAAASPSALPVDVQVECESIRHQHEVWEAGRDNLDRLSQLQPSSAQFEAERLEQDGKAFFDAVTGHPDQSSRELAAAVAQYNVDIGMVGLELTIASSFNKTNHDKAVGSWLSAEAAYGRFLQITCRA